MYIKYFSLSSADCQVWFPWCIPQWKCESIEHLQTDLQVAHLTANCHMCSCWWCLLIRLLLLLPFALKMCTITTLKWLNDGCHVLLVSLVIIDTDPHLLCRANRADAVKRSVHPRSFSQTLSIYLCSSFLSSQTFFPFLHFLRSTCLSFSVLFCWLYCVYLFAVKPRVSLGNHPSDGDI